MKEKRRMISEAARQLGLETYHLRTWEEEFSLTIPRKIFLFFFYLLALNDKKSRINVVLIYGKRRKIWKVCLLSKLLLDIFT